MPSIVKCSKTLTLLSLFSGCGGMDLGFEGGFLVNRHCIPEGSPYIEKIINANFAVLQGTPFRLVFANDILPEAHTAWVNHFGKLGYSPDTYRFESIVDLVKRHRAGERVFPERVDVVTGGFPCQDFSVAGKRRGFNSHKDHRGRRIEGDLASVETRGMLYYWMREVVSIVQPKVFIAENVKGLVNLADVKEVIQQDFQHAGDGYLVLPPRVLHAADFGVSQSRERVIFIGVKRSALREEARRALGVAASTTQHAMSPQEGIPAEYDLYPTPTHGYTHAGEGLQPPVTLGEIFQGLAEPTESDDPSQRYYSRAKYMGSHCQGQKEVNLSGIGPTIRSEHHGNIEFRRLSAAHGGQHREELALGLQERRLTPRECGLIQTFPPDYELVIPAGKGFRLSATGAYRVVGNAVPPLLGYHIAKRLEKVWERLFED
ncbi:MAG: DNA cytosine methyltransferase [Bacteroides sp.]